MGSRLAARASRHPARPQARAVPASVPAAGARQANPSGRKNRRAGYLMRLDATIWLADDELREGRPLEHARVARDARAVPCARARGVCGLGLDEFHLSGGGKHLVRARACAGASDDAGAGGRRSHFGFPSPSGFAVRSGPASRVSSSTAGSTRTAGSSETLPGALARRASGRDRGRCGGTLAPVRARLLEPVMTREALILTPDFPPGEGGIQVLVHRVASSFERYRPHVVTLGYGAGGSVRRAHDPFAIDRMSPPRRLRRARRRRVERSWADRGRCVGVRRWC